MTEFEIVDLWLDELRASLDLTGLQDVDVPALLGTVRTIAHTVIHPAGPVALFAAGYAVARAGGSAEATQATLQRLAELAPAFAAAHDLTHE